MPKQFEAVRSSRFLDQNGLHNIFEHISSANPALFPFPFMAESRNNDLEETPTRLRHRDLPRKYKNWKQDRIVLWGAYPSRFFGQV